MQGGEGRRAENSKKCVIFTHGGGGESHREKHIDTVDLEPENLSIVEAKRELFLKGAS